ncbi:DUF2087 domain-containing protein [Sediminibacillus dalangtanensis]|uniref:DUF2087 domain-containing protein n=1 Tax=Sediminibacillus dalangtanensis TaxID=2729421 RepID=A0ABX7VYC3_9BACI|nr:DUF2087 domain-containing protein [Sediminibacillus dalangtanensis]QTN00589.1 DUF2087 domain-containing protein [Sediminibacillus dalangtanensis]
MSNEDRFWNATIDELSNGYIQSDDDYVCLLCGERFVEGIIYPMDGILYEAKKAVAEHIKEAHSSVFDYLLKMDKKYTGLSDHQKELLQFFRKGLSDKEIVDELDGGSPSTVRNHRFKLKEKEKQAKVFLAIMKLLNNEAGHQTKDHFVHFHKGAKMVDERYATTEKEKQKVLSTYFKQGTDGTLDTFPSKEKRKLIVLQNIVNRFDRDKKYTEKEVNDILKTIYHDFATIRRYLIEYGFMGRSRDCTEYWIKN